METLAFFVLAALAVVSAAVVVTHRHAVMSALGLAMNLLSIAGFYLLLGAQFIGFLQIIVYAGAIMVLILFVVMLLNLAEEERERSVGSIQRWLAPLATFAFVAILGRALWVKGGTFGEGPPPGFGTVESVGRELFSTYFYPFEVLSLLLVVAMIGAVLLAKRRL